MKLPWNILYYELDERTLFASTVIECLCCGHPSEDGFFDPGRPFQREVVLRWRCQECDRDTTTLLPAIRRFRFLDVEEEMS